MNLRYKTALKENLTIQQEKLKKGNPFIKLVKPCRTDHGILNLSETEKIEFIHYFNQKVNQISVTNFIPASGSGSRMFESAYKFINQKSPDEQVVEFIEHFFNCIEDFAFYHTLPESIKQEISSGQIDVHTFINFILNEDGLNFGNLPKGLIPFHKHGSFIINPIQAHILQGLKISNSKADFHFTINPHFQADIEASIKTLKNFIGVNFNYHFSVQKSETDSYVFDDNYNPVKNEQGEYLMRPSGHGALLENLNEIKSDLIFIKNIDNIQHETKSEESVKNRKMLAGITLSLKDEIEELFSTKDLRAKQEKAKFINQKFKLQLADSDLNDENKIAAYFNRPIRICGMVKNEGQPGGGPFWVENADGSISLQIIEKSQISNDSRQLAILIKSTHFNPVEIVCSTKKHTGDYFDLIEFSNPDLYFIVHKTQNGKNIQYIESPGLWNGQMANWLTVFVEINSKCFSPVKTVMDLLNPAHSA